MSGKFYVYEHWRPDRNECFYVGKGKGNRAHNMCSRSAWHKFLQRKLSSLGTAVEVRIIAEGLSEEDAFTKEIERIAFWKNDGADLVNMGNGGNGNGGFTRSEQQKLAISKKLIGRKFSEETRKKMAASARGNSRVRDFVGRGRKFGDAEREAKINAKKSLTSGE